MERAPDPYLTEKREILAVLRLVREKLITEGGVPELAADFEIRELSPEAAVESPACLGRCLCFHADWVRAFAPGRSPNRK